MFAPRAQAFYVKYHETITRNALPADQVSQLAVNQILIGPPPGGGAMGSDVFATDEFRHLDNSINPVDVCNRAQQAWDLFSPVVLSGSVLNGNVEVDGPGARAAFGALLHTQQDFYAHSNFVDDNIAIGRFHRLAPPTSRRATRPISRLTCTPVTTTSTSRSSSPSRAAPRVVPHPVSRNATRN